MMTLEMAQRSSTPWFELQSWERIPALVLAVRFTPIESKWDGGKHFCTTWKWNYYRFKSERSFVPISHQTAGHACHHHHLWVSELAPTAEGRRLIDDVCRWDDSCVGMWGMSLDEILEYRDVLKRHGVDCDTSYEDFEEAIYPIDCSTDALKLLTSDVLPKDLDELVEWDRECSQLCGCVGRWRLYVLGENCD